VRLGCPTRSPEYDSDAIDDGARYARNDFSVSYRVRGRSLARARSNSHHPTPSPREESPSFVIDRVDTPGIK
jgi:hypothetical protein